MHIQSNLLIFNLMGLTERLTYLKILDIQVKIYQLYLYNTSFTQCIWIGNDKDA